MNRNRRGRKEKKTMRYKKRKRWTFHEKKWKTRKQTQYMKKTEEKEEIITRETKDRYR